MRLGGPLGNNLFICLCDLEGEAQGHWVKFKVTLQNSFWWPKKSSRSLQWPWIALFCHHLDLISQGHTNLCGCQLGCLWLEWVGVKLYCMVPLSVGVFAITEATFAQDWMLPFASLPFLKSGSSFILCLPHIKRRIVSVFWCSHWYARVTHFLFISLCYNTFWLASQCWQYN